MNLFIVFFEKFLSVSEKPLHRRIIAVPLLFPGNDQTNFVGQKERWFGREEWFLVFLFVPTLPRHGSRMFRFVGLVEIQRVVARAKDDFFVLFSLIIGQIQNINVPK